MTAYTVVIPARYGSSRLPGKPLADIAGKTMIERVYTQAKASGAQRVVVATDDERIATLVAEFGGEAVMTRADHESGTDRLQEVAAQLQLADDEIIVNVQGDEPLIPPAVIDQVAALLADNADAQIATLCEPIEDIALVLDPNVVKVVNDMRGKALYFSRAPMPWSRDSFTPPAQGSADSTLPAGVSYQRHIGIYGYRVALLHDFVRWPASMLENCEKLEQLRAMENGATIMVAPACEAVPGGVDTPEDLERLRQLLG